MPMPTLRQVEQFAKLQVLKVAGSLVSEPGQRVPGPVRHGKASQVRSGGQDREDLPDGPPSRQPLQHQVGQVGEPFRPHRGSARVYRLQPPRLRASSRGAGVACGCLDPGECVYPAQCRAHVRWQSSATAAPPLLATVTSYSAASSRGDGTAHSEADAFLSLSAANDKSSAISARLQHSDHARVLHAIARA